MLELARNDPRIVAGAEVGSLALGGGDRWSDIDLTFGVVDEVEPVDVLDDWSRRLLERSDGVHLFDLMADPAIYRVFLFRDHLQLDVSVAPASQFRPTSPKFKLLFGEANEAEHRPPPERGTTLGWAVLWARHARVCIEREQWWQAEYAIAQLRHNAMALACLRLDLPASYGKGSDLLPPYLRASFERLLPTSLERGELTRCLSVGIDLLVKECEAAKDEVRIIDRLREMAS
jgi:hypothetical protein